MPISPLGGVAGRIHRQIPKASNRFPICVPLQLFAYLLPFRSYSTFLFWLGFPIWGENIGGFRGLRPPNLNFCDFSLQKALPFAKPRQLSH